jgi:hypothetical protein
MSTSARKRVNVSWDDTISYSEEDQNKVLVSVRSRQKQSQRRKTIPFSCLAILLILLSALCYINYTHRLPPSDESVQDVTDNIDTFLEPTTNKTTDIADYHFQPSFPNLSDCGQLEKTQIDFTLATQSSEDRLWMMKHICSRWGKKHPVSLVLYSNRSYNEVIRDLRKMGCISFNNEDGNVHDKGTSRLQIFDTSQYPPEEYPVNQLRNMALSAVQTSHAVYIDIDLWPSIGLYKSLHHPTVLEALVLDPKLAIVIPSFQLNSQCPPTMSCPDKNLNKMPFTSVELPNLILSKDVTQLDPTNIWGHGSTDYKQWFRIVNSLRKGEDKTYPALSNLTCIKSNRYEPYLAFRVCNPLPPFQEQFTGYGKNKITWIMHLRRIGYRFQQLGVGGDFIIHVPHAESTSRVKWNHGPLRKQPGGKKKDVNPREMGDVDWLKYKRGRIDSLYVAFQQWLDQHVPDTSRVALCKGVLDKEEKLWIHREPAGHYK